MRAYAQSEQYHTIVESRVRLTVSRWFKTYDKRRIVFIYRTRLVSEVPIGNAKVYLKKHFDGAKVDSSRVKRPI